MKFDGEVAMVTLEEMEALEKAANKHISEAYLQQELRKLHRLIEGEG